MSFKVGIIGAGSMSANMADTIRQMKGVDLYAIASRTEQKAQDFAQKYGAEKYYGSYEALMEDAEVDLIYIATPNHLEKPFTLNEQQGQALIDLAEMHQVFICEAMKVRFMPLMLRLKKELEAGRIGEVISVVADMGYDLKEKERVNRLDMGGGALLDIGVYPLSFALQVLGMEIDNVSTSMVHMNSGVDAQELVNLTYTNGAMAGFFTTILANTAKNGTIYGTEGRIEIEDIGNYKCYRVYDAQGALLETVERPEQISGLEYEVEACIHAIQSHKQECPQMTHFDTLFQLRVMDVLRRTWNMQFPQEELVE
jgi:predicted dehydrogenase